MGVAPRYLRVSRDSAIASSVHEGASGAKFAPLLLYTNLVPELVLRSPLFHDSFGDTFDIR